MLSSLMLTAFLMGLGGIPHCAAMCGAACAAFLPRGLPLASVIGRLLGYALLGAVAAAGFGAAAQLGRQVAFLQPIWILVQALVLLLGIWLAWQGAMPRQLDELGRASYHTLRRWFDRQPFWRGRGRAGWPLLAGMAWALLPCGLLYAALMVAALASSAADGALVMLAFALPSSLGVWGAPAVLRRLGRWRSGKSALPASAVAAQAVVPVLWLKDETRGEVEPVSAKDQVGNWVDPRWAIRLSGGMLAAMSAWALYHQIMSQWKAWCA